MIRAETFHFLIYYYNYTIIFSGCGVESEKQESKIEVGSIEDFARCLKNAGVVMYGRFDCVFCERQKSVFGSAVSELDYRECSLNVEECSKLKSPGYPTWKKGEKESSGFKTFKDLSQFSGCEEPIKI